MSTFNTIADTSQVTGEYVSLDGEQHYCIGNVHQMPAFFMSLVGADDHWMFVSSRGALTAGRRNSDHALFPYGTDDQISDWSHATGPTTTIRLQNRDSWRHGEPASVWEPFSSQSGTSANVRQNLLKSRLGTRVTFEENNDDLQLTFRYQWCFSGKFGFVRRCWLRNDGEEARELELLDGFRNILPADVGTEFQLRFSNLGNAYKRSEVISGTGLSVHYLSSIPSDRAEPSEGLRATTVWQAGLNAEQILISDSQLTAFRAGERISSEDDVRGQRCAHLVSSGIRLGPGKTLEWISVAEVDQDHSAISRLADWLDSTTNVIAEVSKDLNATEQRFLHILSSSDAVQCGENQQRTARHLSNTVFNLMRGGVPLNDYRIAKDHFARHVDTFNRGTAAKHSEFLSSLPDSIEVLDLHDRVADVEDADLKRLAQEYLPLTFSRRHGDPTRPWNRFSIELKSESGEPSLNYQGNWRDIFQNWEALGISFPDFFPSMVCRFLNATTADGYNPYRVTSIGIDWEEPKPDAPWSNIGYWNDHQIIYLLKLLEWTQRYHPERLDSLLNQSVFAHANVPYRIKSFDDVVADSQNTIDFDHELAARIRERVDQIGSDGRLLPAANGGTQYATMAEKLLLLTLTKLSNFVPDGGVWLNTQRPEWNDANNAIVGNGLSIVTVCYLHRWVRFLTEWLQGIDSETLTVSTETERFLHDINCVMKDFADQSDVFSAADRGDFVRRVGEAGSRYRNGVYEKAFSGVTVEVSPSQLVEFFQLAERLLKGTIRHNRRSDGLYDAYNLIAWRGGQADVEHLYEMLEGQVAVLSSGILSPEEADDLLSALRASRLYRANQNSYLLYPDRQLPRFMDRNRVDLQFAESNELVVALLQNGDSSIIRSDDNGTLHFHASFRNAAVIRAAIDALPQEYGPAVESSGDALIQHYEDTFGHRKFTGRSGTFFAYEGLGSIYWHMVSKLRLAVVENFAVAKGLGASDAVLSSLANHLREVTSGIGAEKKPSQYGAFPADPYSHTPENAGVKQPGMTGQVKEDLLARFAELGIHIENGCLEFCPDLFDPSELLHNAGELSFFALSGELQTVSLPAQSFGFTLCQVPVIYQSASSDEITVNFADGGRQTFGGRTIDAKTSRKLFSRSGEVAAINCQFQLQIVSPACS